MRFPSLLAACCAAVLVAVVLLEPAHAQQGPPRTGPDTLATPTTQDAPTQGTPTQGTPTQGSPTQGGPTQGGPTQGGPTGTGPGGGASGNAVQMTAQDSLVITVDTTAGDRATLYGESEVTYQQATLKARVIELDLETSVLTATGPPSDSSASRPVFQRGSGGSGGGGAGRSGSGGGSLGGGSGGFTGDVLQYNLRTKRGRVETARTNQNPGYVQGKTVKIYEDSTLFVDDGTYTTCDCPPGQTPSYSLRSNQMKVQDQWVYTGPIQLYLFNVPTPLWLPFGFLPNTSGRRSGPLPPEYGQDRQRGLYLSNWGWYFALNDYTDLQIRAAIYSRGSFWVEPRFRYNKRYNYSGQGTVRFERFQTGEEEDPDFTRRYEGSLDWQHRQTINPTSSFNANVNLQTSNDFNQRNSESYRDNVRQSIGSSINYSKDWPGGQQSIDVSANHNQTLTTGEVQLQLPNVSFSQGSFKPFSGDDRIGDETWWQRITTSYTLDVNNRFNFTPRDPEELRRRGTRRDSTLADSIEQADVQWYEALVDRQKYQLATGNENPYDLQADHRIPINTRFRINRYNLNLTPSISYNSTWRISTQRLSINRDTVETEDGEVNVETEEIRESVPDFFAEQQFSFNTSASTELYGTFPVAAGPFEGLRHRMRPNLSFRYSPNFNAPFWGKTRILRDSLGNPVRNDEGEIVRYDIVDGRRVTRSNEQRTISFSVSNDLETKRVRVDSTGEEKRNTVRLLSFSANTSYNFVAEEFKLSDVSLDARTRYEQFNFQTGFTFSPYQFERTDEGEFERVDQYLAAAKPWKPLRLTRFDFSMSGSFEGEESPEEGRGGGYQQGSGSRGRATSGRGTSGRGTSSRRGPGHRHRQGYINYRIPWSLNFSFNYSLRKPLDRVTSRQASLNGSVRLKITPKWRLEVRSGYDFLQKELVTTDINVYRDLGCWQMSFNWVPFGRNQRYGFNLQVKSGRLAQLLRLNLPRTGEGRLGGIGSQVGGAVGGAVGGGRGGGFGSGGFGGGGF